MAPPATDVAEAKSSPSPSSSSGLHGADGATAELEEQLPVQSAEAGGEGGDEAGGDILLVADCGTEVPLSRSAARMSKTILGSMEVHCAGCRVPVVNVDASILHLVAAYCEKHGPHYDPAASAASLRDPFPAFPINFTPAMYTVKPVTELHPDPHGLKAWDEKLISDLPDNSTLFALIIAADFLAIDDLLDLGCSAVADKMRGKTPEEIRIALDIENDYTTEQEAEVRRENAWAFED